MADANPNRSRQLDSPLFRLIEQTWIDYDSAISSFSFGEENVLRYTLWCVEGLKDNEGDRARHAVKLRALLFQQLRNGTKGQPEELNLLADIIMAYTLECLEWAQTADWTTFMALYDMVYDSVGSQHKESILKYKKNFNDKVFEMNLCASFKSWIVDYLTNDEFNTDEDAEWQGNASRSPDIAPLLKYCSDYEKCETIHKMLSDCKGVEDFKNAIYSIDADGAMIDMDVMNKKGFCEDILPILNYETTAVALKQVIHRLLHKH